MVTRLISASGPMMYQLPRLIRSHTVSWSCVGVVAATLAACASESRNRSVLVIWARRGKCISGCCFCSTEGRLPKFSGQLFQCDLESRPGEVRTLRVAGERLVQGAGHGVAHVAEYGLVG